MNQEESNVEKLARQALSDLLGDRFVTAESAREEHAHDVSHHRRGIPQGVAFPKSNEEIVQIVSLCAEHHIPIIPFGTGTAVEGGVVPTQGGISLDVSRMNQILDVNVQDMTATVQAGVTRQALNSHLEDIAPDFYFPVDPGADASLGGMVATCASGSAAVRYGTMRQNTLGLTVILADGRLIRTGGRVRKSSAGYDLTRLYVGSEGTLGVISEVTVRLTHKPAAVSTATCDFPAIEPAVNTVIDIMTAGIPMARIELLDDVQMAAVNKYSGLNSPVAPTLFFEFHGSETSVVEHVEAAKRIVELHGGGEFQWAVEKSERDRLWQARHDAYYASLAMRPNGAGYVTDVCVPISQLANCIAKTRKLLKSTSIPAPLYGHVGDGNYHVVFVIDPNRSEELAEVQKLSRQIVADALAAGGSCSGEHGIGLGKIDALEDEAGEAITVMRDIKRALDPLNLMNPGKVLRME
ncbi:MAG: FAD-linked oxidase C-terminal domain-containing protein [Planctomycetaceae bacterium]